MFLWNQIIAHSYKVMVTTQELIPQFSLVLMPALIFLYKKGDERYLLKDLTNSTKLTI